ncbi:hypothetical protein ACOSB0_00180, partial [Candidatus Phytoplasma citri]
GSELGELCLGWMEEGRERKRWWLAGVCRGEGAGRERERERERERKKIIIKKRKKKRERR